MLRPIIIGVAFLIILLAFLSVILLPIMGSLPMVGTVIVFFAGNLVPVVIIMAAVIGFFVFHFVGATIAALGAFALLFLLGLVI